MISQTKENYLKALYYLHQKEENISLTDLGKLMEVSKPTVNDMVKKLKKSGWIVYEKYKPLRLTEEGKKASALVIRKHRLSEMFLQKIFGFGWEEVHDIAEEIEHIQSEKFFDKMDKLLGFPTVDPHGSPIPSKEGAYTEHNYRPLSEITLGSKVILKTMKDSSSDFLLFLNKKGLKLGTEIQVIDIESFDKSMVLSYQGQSNIVFSYSVCQSLLVEEV